MDFELSETQKMLKTSARDFLTTRCDGKFVRNMEDDKLGYSPQVWHEMAELGWQGLMFPEEYGGASEDFVSLVVLLEEIGRVQLPSPFLSTVVGGLILMESAVPEQKETLLPRIARGEAIIALAVTEASASYKLDTTEVKASVNRNDYIINGEKLFVQYADVADFMIVTARSKQDSELEDGITVFLVDTKLPGITFSPLYTMAGDRQSEVVFENVRVPGLSVLGRLNHGRQVAQRVLQLSTVAKCAEMVGGAQKALDLSVEYAKQRVQFGRPIGSFQAIQHFCANMLMDVDGCRYLTYEAAWRISQCLPFKQEVAMAKAFCSEAYKRITAKAQQIHGTIGMTSDMDIELYYRRAKTAEVFFGDARFHREELAAMLGI